MTTYMDVDNEPAGGVSIPARLNHDIYCDILPFLGTHEVSSLARTCWYFYDFTLSTLCARSGDVTLRKSTQVRSFHDFLRAGQPSSRVSRIKELHFSIPSHTLSMLNESSLTVPLMEIEIFLDLLRRCTALRRLCLDEWYTEVSLELVYQAAAELPMLQELLIRHTGLDDIVRDICGIAGRPLQKLRLLDIHVMSSPKSLLCIGPTTSNTLRELDLPMYMHELALKRVIFPHVQNLTARVSHDHYACPPMNVRRFARTFPALTHLVLRGSHVKGRWLRHTTNTFSYSQKPFPPEPWPRKLTYVHAHDPLAICTMRLFCRTPHLSIRWWTPNPALAPWTMDLDRIHPDDMEGRYSRTLPPRMLRTIVAVARPKALEICHDLQSLVEDDLGQVDLYDGLVLAGRGKGRFPLRKLAIHIHGFDFASTDFSYPDPDFAGLLGAALAKISITHLLLKFTPQLLDGSLASERPYVPEHAQEARRQSAVCAERLARASPTLRWVGMFVYGASLRSWRIARAADAGANVGMREIGETEGWKVLRAKGLYEFMAAFKAAPRACWK
ncbi:hypothetical protein C8Q80DRAFT_750960 [Daedaleopsis nitida]|nr:hypothetical protein C8Q80DRAFT_750960 [Daedaleopsis nitida]